MAEDVVCMLERPRLPAASFAAALAAVTLASAGCAVVAVDWRPAGELTLLSIDIVLSEMSIATLPQVTAACCYCISNLLLVSIWYLTT